MDSTGGLPSQESSAAENSPLKFALPGWPLSVNSLYQIIWSQRRIEMKPEVRAWKTKAKELVPSCSWAKEKGILLEAHLKFVGIWFYSNGSPRKVDVQNMIKVTVDVIAEKMGFDDSKVWSLDVNKETGNTERVEVRILPWQLQK